MRANIGLLVKPTVGGGGGSDAFALWNSNGTTGSSQTRVSPSHTPTTGRDYYVFASSQNNNHNNAPDLVLTNTGGLSFTRIAQTATANWNTFTQSRGIAALWRCANVTSPGSMTCTVDAIVGTSTFFYAAVGFETTATTINQNPVTNQASHAVIDNASHTSSALPSACTPGKLVIACLAVGPDVAGAPSGLTSGFSAVQAQSAPFVTCSVYKSTTFSGTQFSSTDVGEDVGNSFSILLELN